MDKNIRLAEGDKIEIIDKTSPYFGKTGIVADIVKRNLIMKNDKSGTLIILKLELGGTSSVVEITSHPIPLESQIRKLG